MKTAEIHAGAIYHNGKDGVRKVLVIENVKNPMGDVVQVVTYQLLAAKQEREWNSQTQQMETLIGTTSKISLTGFASWSKSVHDEASAQNLLNGLAAAKLKLSNGEKALVGSMIKHSDLALKSGAILPVARKEIRAARGMAKKGLVTLHESESGVDMELTPLGVAVFKSCQQEQVPADGMTQSQ